jgi:hypothetical protein
LTIALPPRTLAASTSLLVGEGMLMATWTKSGNGLRASRAARGKAAQAGGHLDRCGCAMGARFMGVALLLSAAFYGWPWRSPGLAVLSITWHVLLVSFVAAIAGKIVGILLYRRMHAKRHA